MSSLQMQFNIYISINFLIKLLELYPETLSTSYVLF